MKRVFLDQRRLQIGLLHMAIIVVSLGIADLLQFDFSLSGEEISLFKRALLVAIPVKMLAFALARLNRRWWWQFVDLRDLNPLFIANAAGSLAFGSITELWTGPDFALSIYFIDFLLCFMLTAAARFSVRLYNERVITGRATNDGKHILIYGAGEAGAMLVREIRANTRLRFHIIGFLDDDPRKTGAELHGIPVLGTGADVSRIVEQQEANGRRIEEIIVAMPSATGHQMEEALGNCRAAGLPCKTLPGLGELLSGKVLSSQIRSISVNDLLGREPVRLDESSIRAAIADRTVLVTGAGGSIGSELCRQVAGFGPRRLVALDQAESELFKIDLELRAKFPSLDLAAEMGDIRDAARVEAVMRQHDVHTVFHAAAYKHVPMMEAHVLEAVKNNIFGTRNVVQAAVRNGVSNFLMISSDKAVNPTSVMGVTKRVAELIVSGMPGNRTGNGTRFVSVRFGNVLGSNGSVVPIFQSQIAAGGPVTVTHPDARRYFMTIREAVQLVLQASTMGSGSEIFVLDMGEPIRIADLARNMIRLSGLVPDQDIEIRYMGMRPGEKIFEEITTQGEHVLPTYHAKIKIFEGPRVSRVVLEQWMNDLQRLLGTGGHSAIVEHFTRMVPEYEPFGSRIDASEFVGHERAIVSGGSA